MQKNDRGAGGGGEEIVDSRKIITSTAFIGALVPAITMVGAMLAWIFFLDSPGAAVFPAIILGMLLAIALNARPGRT